MENVNDKMAKFYESKNEIGLLYNEYTIKYGKEYYLASLANSILNSFNTFERFYPILEDKDTFADKLLDLASNTLDLLRINTNESLGKMRLLKKRRIVKKDYEKNLEKVHTLLNKIDEINEFLTKNCENIAK